MEERVLKYLPFAGGLLIFLGVLKITIYFQYFGVSILSYLSLSDVLLLFLNDLNTVLALVIIGTVHIATSDEVSARLGHIIDQVVIRLKWFYIVFFGVLITFLSFLLCLSKIDLAIWNIYLLIFLATQFLTVVFVKKTINEVTNQFEVDFYARKLLMVLITVVATGMMPLLAIKDVQQVKRTKMRITLYLRDGDVISNSTSTYYLGKAGDYHFFFDSVRKTSVVIFNSDVKKIEKRN